MNYSTNFKLAIQRVLENEGGYVNDPNDSGGETKYGITKRYYPKLDIANLTPDQAMDIYYRDYWRPEYELLEPMIAEKVFDMAVNMGHSAAHRCLQRALMACELRLADDGVIGKRTMAACASIDPHRLITALRSEHASYYRVLVALRPSQSKFLNGWLKRAYK